MNTLLIMIRAFFKAFLQITVFRETQNAVTSSQTREHKDSTANGS
jgi:hypothetical protein